MAEDICKVSCQVNVIHQKQVMQASENMPGEYLVSEAAELFSLLGDNSRLRILLEAWFVYCLVTHVLLDVALAARI